MPQSYISGRLGLLGLIAIGLLTASAATVTRGADEGEKTPVDRCGDPLPRGAVARLGSVRFRHPAVITMLAVAPSGKEAMTICQSSSMLRRCDLETGEVSDFLDLGIGFRAFPSNQRTAFYFAEEGKRLLSVGSNYVEAIDLEKKASLWKKANLRAGAINCSTISPDGRWLAVVQPSDGGRLLILNTQTGEIAQDISRVTNSPGNVAFTHDSSAVTVASHNQRESLRSWSVADGKELPPLKEISNGGLAIAYSPDGKWLAVGQAQRTVLLFDLQTRTVKHTLGGFTSILRWTDFTGDGKSVLAFDGTGTTVFDIESGKELRKFAASPSPALPVVSADGKTLITCSGNVIDSWNIDTGEALHPTEGHRSMVYQMAISPDGRLACTFGQDNLLLLWDLTTGEQLYSQQRPRYASPTVAFTPDGEHLLWANTPTSIEFLDVSVLTKKKEAPATPAPDVRGNQFANFAVSDDGETLVASNSAGGGVQIWDLTKKPPTLVYLPPSIGAQSVVPFAFSPDARLSATLFSADGSTQQVLIADLTQRGREVTRLVSPTGLQVLSGEFAGTRLFASRSQRQLALWDVLSGKPVVTVGTADPAAAITAIACSADGRLLAWAESDPNRTIHLYDSLNGREVGKFGGHAGFVQCLRLYTAGDHPVLVSGSLDSTSLVWDLRPIMEDLRRSTPSLAEQQPAELWADLGAEDAAAMHRASWVLTAAGEEAVPLLAQRLEPVPIDRELGEKVAKLVEQMDNDLFSVREQASQQAALLGDVAEPFLMEALKTTASAEARHRIRRLLADIAAKPLVVSSDQQRTLRAVQILEQIGGNQSREVLRHVVEGQPLARLTQEAKNALARLERTTKR